LTNREKILAYLKAHSDNFISGEALATSLEISRSAVSKNIKILIKEGHKIESRTNKGYKYFSTNNIIIPSIIEENLDETNKDINIIYRKVLASTNDYAKKYLAQNNESALIICEEQTKGRGRYDRKFYSPKNKGIYMSILLNRNFEIPSPTLLTVSAAVAVRRAISELYSFTVDIKWVNDIFIFGKKLGGILTEGVTNFESGEIESVIIGIGLNTGSTKFPKELEDKAISLSTFIKVDKNRLIATITNKLIEIINEEDRETLIKEYKEASFILNKNIFFKKDKTIYSGIAKDIDSEGRLIIEDIYKNSHTLNNGEVSISFNSLQNLK